MNRNLILVLSGITAGTLSSCKEGKDAIDSFPQRPNILWITCEDISPYLGSYGYEHAHTPNLDELAAKGIRHTNAWANAPVCAVARSAILTGMHSSTIGTHQMRSRPQLPASIPAYSAIFREAGYYTTNNVKTDYNSSFEHDLSLIWDESSRTAHFRNRAEGQPFFAVFNITATHESQLATDRIAHYVSEGLIPEQPRVDPQELTLPPYHPDLPEIRQDWARFHDLITLMDRMTGDILRELEEEGLADNTIVFFYADHGGMLARSKRYIYNVGTQVPLIVHLPEKWRHLSKVKPGNTDNRMVNFVDLAPTVLSIAGLEVPEIMQGKPFLGKKLGKKPVLTFFYRDRMSERYDFSRAVTDGRYYFIRHFNPHKPEGRDSRYGPNMHAGWRAWEEAFEQGLTDEVQSRFFQPKDLVYLFDTQNDPWHINNLSEDQEQRRRMKSLSDALDKWMIETRDIGLIPEPMFHQLAGPGLAYPTMYDYAQSNDYPVATILVAAKIAAEGRPENIPVFLENIAHNHPVMRYWGAYGLFQSKTDTPSIRQALLQMAQKDLFAANRIMAAQALAMCGDPERAFNTLWLEARDATVGYGLLQAISSLQYSKTDDRLSLEDWEYFRDMQFENDYGIQFARRIIDDAIELYPERRKVY
jgi:N-sulfoglucosamine sulfohydrolase